MGGAANVALPFQKESIEMPRSAGKPFDKVLEYFRTAPESEAGVILHQAKGILQERSQQTMGATRMVGKSGSKPGAKSGAKAAGKPAQAKKKPGPKPGAKKAKQNDTVYVAPDGNSEVASANS